jgi:hypothetical protein
MRPVDPVTPQEAASVLGCSTNTVRRRVRAGVLSGSDRPLTMSRAEVEELARDVYPWWRHVDDPESYWVTGAQAAEVLRVSRARLGQLAEKDRVPYMRHRDGTRLYRRQQIGIVAQVRMNPFGND